MTDQERAVMQQALEALQHLAGMNCDHSRGICVCEYRDAANNLSAALAQAEPVAWMYTGIKQDGTEHGPHLVWKPEYMDAMSASKGAKATPLYTTPPRQSDLQIEDRLARHGIPMPGDPK